MRGDTSTPVRCLSPRQEECHSVAWTPRPTDVENPGIDVKPSNILVNRCNKGDVRFKDVCLADLGDAVLTEGTEATTGYPVGTTVFRSPEATLMMPFTTAHDIWSFGSTVRGPDRHFSAFTLHHH